MNISFRKWYLIDSSNKVLGRLITRVVYYLMGKNKSNYLPYKDGGNFVILININKIVVTGKKFKKKIYYRHSGYVGNLKSISFENMFKKSPEYIIRKSVYGMLPKNTLGRCFLKRLRVFNYSNHIYNSHKPVLVKI